MYTETVRKEIQETLKEIEAAGLYKLERIIVTEQGPEIKVQSGQGSAQLLRQQLISASRNNKELIEAACDAMHTRGWASRRCGSSCGTQDLHKKLERAVRSSSERMTQFLYTSVSTRTAASSKCSSRGGRDHLG